MGIDIYARWDDMTEDETQAQYTGFDIHSGHVGYLREAYHGEPYVTRFLVGEAFLTDAEYDSVSEVLKSMQYEGSGIVGADPFPLHLNGKTIYKDASVAIPAQVLRERLPKAKEMARERERIIYKGKDDRAVQAFEDFVALIEEKEKAGLHPRVYASY